MYASPQHLRDTGAVPAATSDARLAALLADASEYIDAATFQWFEPRALTLRLDGTGGPALPLPAPPLALTAVALDGAALALADVVVYGHPDHRDYPRLARRGGLFGGHHAGRGDAPRARRASAFWPRGAQNVTITGTFGYVAADGVSAPAAIRRVAILLALRGLAPAGGAAAGGDRAVVKEVSDGHSYELGDNFAGAPGAWRRDGATGDPAIDVVLMRYRRAPAGGLV